jgi:N-acetylglutamate synthase-like GNAT family acetyltransferase
MKIIDLTPQHEQLYFCCLEDWSHELKEAGNHKETWYRNMKDKGIRIKLAQDDDGTIGGMIQYLPVENSFVHGKDLYLILCIWVHGYKKGRGNFQKKGMGKALLHAAEEDVRSLGSKGLIAWGLVLPFFMKASWFKRHGYKVADKDGMTRLLWKAFSDDAVAPQWIKKKKIPERGSDKVNISVFINGWCPAQNLVYERTKRASAEFGNKVVLNEYWTNDKEVHEEWGISDALYIDNRQIRTGPPPSYKKIKKKINRKVNKIQ